MSDIDIRKSKTCHIKGTWVDPEGTRFTDLWCGKKWMAEKALEDENDAAEEERKKLPRPTEEELRKSRAEANHCQGCLKAKTKFHGIQYMQDLGFPLPNSMRKKK